MRNVLPAIVQVIAMLYCVPFSSHAQQPVVTGGFAENKKKAIQALQQYPMSDTARVNALIRVTSTATFFKERKELLPYQAEIKVLSERLHYAHGLIEYYFAAASYYKSASDYTNALTNYDSALNIIGNSQDSLRLRQRATIYERKGMIYQSQENYHPALSCFFEALKYNDPVSVNRTVRLNVFVTEIYTILENLDKALVFATRNIELLEKNPSTEPLAASVYFSAINVFLEKNDLVSASFYLDKVARWINNPQERLVSFGYYMKKGHILYRKQQYPEAFLSYQQAYQLANDGGHHKESISISLRYLSATALRMGNHTAARSYAERNLELADTMNMKAAKIEALANLADYYHATGNNDRAFELSSQALLLKESLIAETNTRQINMLGAMYEREEQEKKIAALQNERELQKIEAQEQALLNKLFIASIVALLGLGYLGYNNFRKGQQLAQNQQALQRQKISELEKDKQLLSIDAMMKGQEEERGRIAKDLHDGLGGLLSGTKLSFMTLKDKLPLSADEHVQFDKSLSMLDNTMEDLRKVAQNLMPGALMRYGLYEALRDFCEHIQFSTGVRVVYERFGEPRKPDKTASVFIYRIVQELVNNAVKHAEASQLIVQLTTNGDKIRITVEDDGKGFDKRDLYTAKGAGMTNINYRVQYLHGQLDIQSSPGNGTSVNIELTV